MADLRKSVISHAIIGIVYLMSGLVINFLQAILFVLLYYTNRWLYRKLNYYLMYATWSQFVALAEWWSGTTCNLYGTEEDLKQFGTEHSITVMNHLYEIDFVLCWVVTENFGMLGGSKSFAKSPLKYLPVIGWGWVFAELIFLERNWNKDKQTLGAKLDKLAEYEDIITLLLFAEGTRLTPEKHKASLKFARDHGLPELKYHLLPRTKGFNFSVTHLKSKMNAIYDIQLAFRNDARPTIYDLLCGRKFVADIHVRRIPMSEIPTDSDEATTQFLYEMYKKKDELMENYLKTSTFPGKCIELKRSLCSLINTLFWMIFVGVPLLYLIWKLLFSGNPWIVALTVTGIVLVLSMMHVMMRLSNADRGSSYGTTSSSRNNNGVTQEPVVNGECSPDLSHSEATKCLHENDAIKTKIS